MCRAHTFLKAIFERIDGWRINIFLRPAIPSVCNPLKKRTANVYHRQFFPHLPAFGRNVTRKWQITFTMLYLLYLFSRLETIISVVK